MTVTNVLVSRRRAKFVVLLVLCIGLGFSRGSSAQSFLNAQRSGGTGADAGQAIAADAAGNTYVTGFFSDAVSFGATESRFSPSSDMFLAKYDPNGGLVWLQQAIGGDGSAGWGVAVDSAQNVYVTGGFGAGGTGGSAIFPDLPHAYTRGDPQHTIHTVQTTDAGFVAKYDSAGTLQWVRSIGDSTLGFAIAVHSATGAVYVTGNFTYEADFGDGSLRAPNGFGSGAFFGADMFVVKYDTDGSTQWVDTFGATDNDGGLGIAVDASGDPHVTGYFKGSVTFGATTLTAASSFGTAFVAKLNRASGGAIWAKSGAPFTSGNAIAVDSAGNSYVAGVSVLAKFDGDPNHPKPLWYAAILGSIVSFGVAIDTAGNSYITGSFFGTINFFPPTSVWPPPCLSLLCLTGTQVAPGNTLALFTAKFDSAGRVSYFNHVGTTGPSALETGGIAVAGGNFYTTGSFGGVASFPYNAPVVTLASAGEFDVFRAQYAGTAGATHFDLSGLPQQPVTAGNSFFFTVTALDASNNIVPGYTGTVQLTSNDPRAVFLPTAATLTNGTGQFSASLRTAGSNVTITATDANIASIQGTSGPIVVNPGPATHFEFVGFPQSTTAGAPITFTLRALDAANNLATGYQGTALVVSDRVNTTGASGQLSAGQRQFTLALTKPGEILIATDTQNNSITGTSPAIVVSPGPAARLAIFVALPIANGQFAAAAGSPFNLTVSVRDLFDNSVASFGGLVQFTSTDPNRILPPDSPVPNGLGTFKAVLNTNGSQTITATSAGLLPASTLAIVVTGYAAPITGNVPVTPLDPATGIPQTAISVTFSNVTTPGGLSAVQTQVSPPPNFRLNGVAYDITAGLGTVYSGQVTVCFAGSVGVFDALMHYENGSWVSPPQQLLPPTGPPYTQLCVTVDSLSPFAVFTAVATVPSVVGSLQSDAQAAITAAGLTVGTVTTASSDSVPAGTVISQDPAGGATVTPGSAVTLVISSGPSAGPSTFAFQGFFAPVDMSTSTKTVWNTVKAGQTVPVKWLLTRSGVPVTDPASFAGLVSYVIACPSDSGSIEDPIDEIAAGSSGLQYTGDGIWQFNWKTLSSYKNCRAVAVKFSDGTTSPAANFKFK